MTLVQASVRTVQESIASFGDAIDYVAVKNLAFGAEETFLLFDGCAQPDDPLPISQGKRALLERGGVIIHLPALPARSYALLDLYSLGYLEAVEGRGLGARMPLADRWRVRQWVLEFDAQLTPAHHLLGFAEGTREGVDAPACVIEPSSA